MSARNKVAIWLVGAAVCWAVVIGAGHVLAAAAKIVWGAL